ncbi:zf-HC2 domain-containing protein [Amnibacterium kyonggiense]|uniref:Putative zinc finger protein n=1 Tax=Amnibacterium kyonggiense TaxID=595671 RepID=A0A4V3EAS6_9MICO|nr:zf-HC2 domain-containing protein [Amnibacterium kyonggiense]TDS77154.1 putative zinc finger protein [Amnibacterium kyonggiense]
MSDSIHDWDGAYVLGALEPADRHRYEEHLASCSSCSRSVRELAGLPGILGTLDEAEALALRDLPDDAALRDGAHASDRAAGVARRVRSRRRRNRLVTALALAAVLVVGSIGGWGLVRAVQPASQPAAAAQAHRLEPIGDSHLTADLRVTPVGWGTRIDWSCDYAATASQHTEQYEPTSYSLVVHTDTGGTATVATWTSDGGEARNLVASTAIPADDIASVDIRVTGSSRPLASTSF